MRELWPQHENTMSFKGFYFQRPLLSTVCDVYNRACRSIHLVELTISGLVVFNSNLSSYLSLLSSLQSFKVKKKKKSQFQSHVTFPIPLKFYFFGIFFFAINYFSPCASISRSYSHILDFSNGME